MQITHYVSHTPETIFEKAVCHHYRDCFDFVVDSKETLSTTYFITQPKLEGHKEANDELWQALKDPVMAAHDLRNRLTPQDEHDLGESSVINADALLFLRRNHNA